MEEVEALVAGARMIEVWGGPALARNVRSAISKIALALPKSRREEIDRPRLFALAFHIPPGAAAGLETIRRAVIERRKLRIRYVDSGERASARTVWPLALYFWGASWSVAAWCESRQDYHNFRLDRIRGLEATGDKFEETAGRSLEDFVRRMSG